MHRPHRHIESHFHSCQLFFLSYWSVHHTVPRLCCSNSWMVSISFQQCQTLVLTKNIRPMSRNVDGPTQGAHIYACLSPNAASSSTTFKCIVPVIPFQTVRIRWAHQIVLLWYLSHTVHIVWSNRLICWWNNDLPRSAWTYSSMKQLSSVYLNEI